MNLKIKDITGAIEELAPLSYQESYDNAGLIVGDASWNVTGVLICVDAIEEVVEEAYRKGANLIIAHHPIVFSGLKRFNGNNYIERTVILAIRYQIAIYASHTNMDAVLGGINSRICDKLGLINRSVLSPVREDLKKLVTFVPSQNAEKVRNALFKAGAGCIGNYDSCSYNLEGTGSFRGGKNSNPFVGEKGKIHYEPEIRIETIFQKHLQNTVLEALLSSHPYEEVAYDIYNLDNINYQRGIGMVGELETPENSMDFLKRIKEICNAGTIRHTAIVKDQISRIAVCGGSGNSLLNLAVASHADMFISSDFKYHDFFNAEGKIIIADVGHYESEQFSKEIFYELITKKFPNFAPQISDINTNPINYL